jgi:hypothetical protein
MSVFVSDYLQLFPRFCVLSSAGQREQAADLQTLRKA